MRAIILVKSCSVLEFNQSIKKTKHFSVCRFCLLPKSLNKRVGKNALTRFMEVARSGYWASAFHVFVSQPYQDFLPCQFGTNIVFAIFAPDFFQVVSVCMIFAPSKFIFFIIAYPRSLSPTYPGSRGVLWNLDFN